ncbi:MAG: Transcriptional regulatory protein TcrA [candidate division WS6 bacterium OLB20]|uniref:Transcriptional regulatory protein TcrA n=1 Tax=candidate division WS6 bacterium OLB20 TaxID=1617426 RepID=A0A136LZ40_9BACT|nr:MAG: Transcriptional regulatory protein TcrA [candidate division WS6 bacterium OLB20]
MQLPQVLTIQLEIPFCYNSHMKLLLIEDEEQIGLPLKRFLEKQGFAVDYYTDGAVGQKEAQVNAYDCIILDLNLPGKDGLEVAASLRKAENTTPVLMLTARSQQYDKISGFEHGADDYVTKPFHLKELLLRIQALIRRNSHDRREVLRAGNIEVIPAQRVVTRNGTAVDLTAKEFGILEYLIRNGGRPVSQEELLEHVWDSEVDSFTQTVKTTIKTLRQKIDPQKSLIETVRGAGYRIANTSP